eukprot:PhF_6_TR1984/c0_g1_i1/m.3325
MIRMMTMTRTTTTNHLKTMVRKMRRRATRKERTPRKTMNGLQRKLKNLQRNRPQRKQLQKGNGLPQKRPPERNAKARRSLQRSPAARRQKRHISRRPNQRSCLDLPTTLILTVTRKPCEQH